MDSQTVITRLKEHESELRAAGVVTLSLFGSVARGDAHSDSDVDLMAEFDKAKRLTLFSLSGVRLQIMDILGAPVDLADRHMLKDDIRMRAEREELLVF
jgi:predicted nucleotidyltransferase